MLLLFCLCFFTTVSFKWRHSTSSTICPLVKAKTYCRTCWTQTDPENVMTNKPQAQSVTMPRPIVQRCRRLTTDVWFNKVIINLINIWDVSLNHLWNVIQVKQRNSFLLDSNIWFRFLDGKQRGYRLWFTQMVQHFDGCAHCWNLSPFCFECNCPLQMCWYWFSSARLRKQILVTAYGYAMFYQSFLRELHKRNIAKSLVKWQDLFMIFLCQQIFGNVISTRQAFYQQFSSQINGTSLPPVWDETKSFYVSAWHQYYRVNRHVSKSCIKNLTGKKMIWCIFLVIFMW